jgi:hypothetical protein
LWHSVNSVDSFIEYQTVMAAGGISAGYLGGDCWPDLVYSSGAPRGVIIYKNNAGKSFTLAETIPGAGELGTLFTGAGIADLSGDYRHEIVLGNLTAGNVIILKPDDAGRYHAIAELPMSRNTFGMAFGQIEHGAFPSMYLGHWDYNGLPGTAPALWRNVGGSSLSVNDKQAGVAVSFGVNQAWQFTPSFADLDGDGYQDLLVASDFGSTSVFRNTGKGSFVDATDRSVITDENGMGSALGDFRNSGQLDWFVSAVYDPSQKAKGHWGVHGNRMYRNDSRPGVIRFTDVTDAAGVRDGLWGWGACAADFNNDGWLDILQVDGYGYLPRLGGMSSDIDAMLRSFGSLLLPFAGKSARLFMNRGDGTFDESAAAWRINLPMNGRGLACFDYDRDGDIDVAVLDHSRGIKFFENHTGVGPGRHMLSIRLVGNPPNTDALGAKVFVTADLNGDGEIGHNETQLRVAEANSNFNSQNPPDLFFGLGKAEAAVQIKIVWPDGGEQIFDNVAADQFLNYRQPQ